MFIGAGVVNQWIERRWASWGRRVANGGVCLCLQVNDRKTL